MPATTSNSTESAAAEEDPSGEPTEARNLVCLAMQQIVIRIGWIFKTESVIIPSFVDVIAGPGWVRGCLPILNRLGQSIPQFLFADKLRAMPLKRRPLGWSAVLMGAPFLFLSGLLAVPGSVGSIWLPALFLVLYLFFFSMTGLNQLSMGTITGKLIRPNRRGRLIALAGVVGVTLATTTAWNMLPQWLEMNPAPMSGEVASSLPGFVRIFLFVGTMFTLAGGVASFVREDADTYEVRKRTAPFGDAWRRVRSDKHFARLLVVSMLFVSSLLLVPHYQALARADRNDFSQLMVWVVSQNISAGFMALVSGMLADRFGFRLSIRMLLLLAGCCPLVGIALATYAEPKYFVIMFVLFGAIPNTFRAIESYALELTDPTRHAQYISTLKLFMPIAFLFSPLVGWLIDRIGFAPVFITIGVVNLIAMVLTFFITEPRNWRDV